MNLRIAVVSAVAVFALLTSPAHADAAPVPRPAGSFDAKDKPCGCQKHRAKCDCPKCKDGKPCDCPKHRAGKPCDCPKHKSGKCDCPKHKSGKCDCPRCKAGKPCNCPKCKKCPHHKGAK